MVFRAEQLKTIAAKEVIRLCSGLFFNEPIKAPRGLKNVF